MVEIIESDNFDKEVREAKLPVIVDFFADWCGPCQMMAPVFEELSQEYKGRLKFVKLNTDEAGEIAGEFEVSGIPCLIVLEKGKEVARMVGFMPKQLFKQKIDEALARVK